MISQTLSRSKVAPELGWSSVYCSCTTCVHTGRSRRGVHVDTSLIMLTPPPQL